MHAQTKVLPAGAPVIFSRLLLPSYAATLFLSAGLLFLVQPMVAKMVLPHLGGSPSVWNTSMCFFQATLLLGYAYAHLLVARFSAAAQAVIHCCTLLIAASFLPLDLTKPVPPASGIPAVWLIGQLAISVGPPLFAVSATAPLLQRWFSQTDHPAAADPYFLYASSNAGSLSALVAYPLLVEQHLPLPVQSRSWMAGFALMAIAVTACWVGSRCHPRVQASARRAAERPSPGDRLRWIAYAALPSALVLAVTAHITTDLASAPLFWVVPLGLYLLSFIFTFARRPPLPLGAMLKVQPFLIIPLVVVSAALHNIWVLALHLALFFVTAMICHSELSRRRPPAENLTEFYLYVSLGGVLGGLFAALVAPAIFPDIWEYPLLLVLSCLARPAPGGASRSLRWADIALPLLLVAGLAVLVFAGDLPPWVFVGTLTLGAVALLQFSERSLRFALGVAGCLLIQHLVASSGALETVRTFFGVYRVVLVDGGAIRVLQHGTTIHGAESTLPGEETLLLGYYSREGPFGRFFTAIADRNLKQVGVIGLGTGGLACYSRPGEVWNFHEIDLEVEKIARDARYFHFLERCGHNARVVLGDARLTLQNVADHHYDAIIIDAFSSDSIPMHLLTREALALYQRKLAADEIILFHISNRYLDLSPVIAALADDSGSSARHLLYLPPPSSSPVRLGAEVVAVGQPGDRLAYLTASAGWQPMAPLASVVPWTDWRSDIVSRIKWRDASPAPSEN